MASPPRRRVAKLNASNQPTKIYWYGSGGSILAETDASGTATAEYVFFGGQRIAMLPAGGGAQYYVEDMLGSTRVVTTYNGVVCYDADFTPFGFERIVTNSCTQNKYKFEGKERDDETGNDDFGARYYSNRFGRWLSADWSAVPVPVPYANLTNPQTLNLYAMVADDPESFADLDGHLPGENGISVTEQQQNSVQNDNGPQTKKTTPQPPPPQPPPAQQQAAKSDSTIITTSFTTAAPTTALGVFLGELIDPLGGGAVGGLIGSEFGVGVTGSYVPSTNSSYLGITGNFTPTPGGGTGASVNALIVPPTQNPNSIANGPTFSVTIQPTPVTGVTVTKSPGSGPAVAGPSVGTRVPVSYSASYDFNITHLVKAVSKWF